jgi:hypothetical protein
MAAMAGYRIYRVSNEGHFVGVDEVDAASDSDAMMEAHKLLDGLDVEVWRGNEKIGYLRAHSLRRERSNRIADKRSSGGDHQDSA